MRFDWVWPRVHALCADFLAVLWLLFIVMTCTKWACPSEGTCTISGHGDQLFLLGSLLEGKVKGKVVPVLN
jgi:hypothetical protein